jgi:hypothetical protein
MARTAFNDTRTGALSWFDPEAARLVVEEDTYWDGNNRRGNVSGLQCGQSTLYLTQGGRWLENTDATREFNGGDRYTFLTEDEARDWLVKSGDSTANAVLEQHFPDTPEEQGPPLALGRKRIGPKVEFNLPDSVLAAVDERAKTKGIPRAEMLRQAVEAWLTA